MNYFVFFYFLFFIYYFIVVASLNPDSVVPQDDPANTISSASGPTIDINDRK